MDSTIARPTNKVRVMVAEASGCCASDVNAVATARPSPSAGPILPRAIVRPEVTIEAIAMSVMLSIVSPFAVSAVSILVFRFGFWLVGARGSRDVYRGQDAEDIGLHHPGEQSEH